MTRGIMQGSRWLLGIVLVLLSGQALAQTGPITTQSIFFDDANSLHGENFLDLTGGVLYSDNVGLTHDGSGDTMLMVGLVGDTKREGAPRLDYHIDSDIALVHYLSQSFDTQPFGYFDGSGEFKIVPGLFSWTARDSFS